MIAELQALDSFADKVLAYRPSKTHNGHGALYTVSLFSGGGGLDLGLESVGFHTLFATDIDKHSCITLTNGKQASADKPVKFLNDATIVCSDIKTIEPSAIKKAIALKDQQLSLLAGGPPCQAFSIFGQRKGRDDPRGQLGMEYIRMLSGLRPKAFIFENVFGLLTIENGNMFKELCVRLETPCPNLKYTLSILRVNAADFGVPQFRDRVFIIGDSDGATIPPTAVKQLTFQPGGESLDWRTVKDAFVGLPKIGADYPLNHTGRVQSQKIIDRYASLVPGERDHFTRVNKLNLKRPSFTIIVGSDHGGGKGHIHPTEPREVTPRESARIQTFPDWWAFSGTSRHPIRQIGNAVPPLLAAIIGNEIRCHIFHKQRVCIKDILSALGQEHLFIKEFGNA